VKSHQAGQQVVVVHPFSHALTNRFRYRHTINHPSRFRSTSKRSGVQALALVFVASVAFVACGLIVFPGFGIGAILIPTFGLLMPIEVAVAAIRA